MTKRKRGRILREARKRARKVTLSDEERARWEPILETLLDMFPEDWVEKTATETGLIQRERKIDPFSLLWSGILSFGVKMEHTLAAMKRGYEEHMKLEETLSDGSWYARFTPELVAFLRAAAARGIGFCARHRNRQLRARLERFRDVLIQDSTIVRLHASLATKWPAARSSKAAAGVKVATLVSAVNDAPERITIHGERTPEVKTLDMGPWVEGIILLIDLGFYKHHTFARIVENGGDFVVRLKDSADPYILHSNEVHRGRSIGISEHYLSEVSDRLTRKYVDATVTLDFKRQKYNGKRRPDTLECRLVGVRNDETGQHHYYLTSLGPEILSAQEVADLYRCRWEIEILFKELKGRYALDKMEVKKAESAEALIWLAILTLLVSRLLHGLFRNSAPPDVERHRYTRLLWANVFTERAGTLLQWIIDPGGTISDEQMMQSMILWDKQVRSHHVGRAPPTSEWWI